MRGISEERLREIVERYCDPRVKAEINYLIEYECEELNQWLPIDENTPKNRVLWLFSKNEKYIGKWESGGIGDGLGYWSSIPFGNKLMPTYYQELPTDPKECK